MDDIKRIIPCLDIRDGRLVKGVRFKDVKDLGDPVEVAKYYEEAGADELIILDIGAGSYTDNESFESLKSLEYINKIRSAVKIPLIYGGGIEDLYQISNLLSLGIDKVSIGTAAVEDPLFITKVKRHFGKDKTIVSIDVKKTEEDSWEIYVAGGTKGTGIDALEFAHKIETLGAGELLVTSIDRDGTNDGYDIDLVKAIKGVVDIPVIASGGAGRYEDFYDVFVEAGADAALAASLFHYGHMDIGKLKEFLTERGLNNFQGE
ncbi:MAG: imidazole glycerol phosphate synthase subunit HisF [Clostridiales bacterium]|nr:imidazole glycerol phosphate synthase subunit HisF [Clostridiales bacterium]